MMIQPNKTKITATILSSPNEEGDFEIVILTFTDNVTPLPAFLWVGKILKVEGKNMSAALTLEKGLIISAEIEVLGDPRIQKYLLHSIELLNTEEE